MDNYGVFNRNNMYILWIMDNDWNYVTDSGNPDKFEYYVISLWFAAGQLQKIGTLKLFRDSETTKK